MIFTIGFREQAKGLKNDQEAKKEAGRENEHKVHRRIKRLW